LNERISTDPRICGGEPCVKGTRIPVHIVLGHLAAGDDRETILKNFSRITEEDIRACFEYAAYLSTEKALPL